MIELLLCLCIISILLSISICKFYLKDYKIDSFVRQLCTDIRYVRIKNINSDYSTYIYYKKKPNGVNSYVLREDGKDKKEVELPQNTDIYYSCSKVIFNLTGSLNYQGDTIVIIDRDNNKKREITIIPFSGRTLIKECIYKYGEDIYE
ncbi:hypothetical protein [Tepidibacter thalassicus]|uniref:Competence protein ComGD n=1 Tax=Tepidibacter thalassicus DSM 15285 TaxID=1123350 RepID=A0A1M5Q139_9FIRM|nr:hypothetical protein [Tepidibacter thalassicus]SHH07844.1 hypothetical protein SAMN02744040_00736 [Tepidibacter thalassicus DSM 15285]